MAFSHKVFYDCPSLSLLPLLLYYSYYHTRGAHVKVRGQLCGISSPLHPGIKLRFPGLQNKYLYLLSYLIGPVF